ncbi:UDP-N-acetylmuramoyl-tripeptide--D-alanyl-D-alanine ligase [Phaeobacter sp. 11ANDIMAR09]|uniref:UDP-N-acetylmuramoyl-tripeptide--D-alanyl-D- alanine ligase n=1 Tax=Phaeobacter sp. 11ANDIMAR09 TaxID=1225647 RepID=UPI0006C86B42|nr:UDP-N-acetylmuramoyl-tripeptide--D-alanyl-D-alanine ligase [Phaeobacter sp. 11ANDIMAR09]KPD12823.1 UDP-N-acetylmuramoyl-tripeptide--D-alanyl-D-alanine ligase [Phaeobacter sp. 11ANDIMAR09]
MSALWTAAEAATATGGEAIGDWQVSGISIDTRTLQPGDLFVALKAARDGHDFVAHALEKSAGAALVTHRPAGVAADAPLLIVEDVQAALEGLGQVARARTQAKVIAVTGSVGKTSTKEMLACMLADQGRTHAAVASYNNHWGVPLTLARMPRDTEFAVIEIGMNHPGEIAPLARQARPHLAMVTTVAAVHLEAFEDVAGIAREKSAIMEGLELGGIAVLNADIEEAQILAAEAQRLGVAHQWFGEGATEYKLLSTKISGEATLAEVRCGAEQMQLTIQSLGAHFAMNALGALACVAAVGADVQRAAQVLALWSPVQGRGARVEVAMEGGKLLLLDDSYNANPTSMAAALAVLAATPDLGSDAGVKGRKIAYLGDMGELGPQEVALHAGLADLAALEAIDRVHCIGPLMAHLHQALPAEKRGSHYATSEDVLPDLPTQLGCGDIVLAKGSLSAGLSKIVDGIRELGHGKR